MTEFVSVTRVKLMIFCLKNLSLKFLPEIWSKNARIETSLENKHSINPKVFENFTFSFGSNCNSKKWIIWFIMISPAKFQPPNPSITASNCIPRFWSFGRFVWKSKKLPNFFIFHKPFSFLFWISWFGYLKVLHVEFSWKLFLV